MRSLMEFKKRLMNISKKKENYFRGKLYIFYLFKD